MSEKICVFCQNFEWVEFTIGGGCETCGEWIEGGLKCHAGKFSEENPWSDEKFRELIQQAATCDKYLPPVKGSE